MLGLNLSGAIQELPPFDLTDGEHVIIARQWVAPLPADQSISNLSMLSMHLLVLALRWLHLLILIYYSMVEP